MAIRANKNKSFFQAVRDFFRIGVNKRGVPFPKDIETPADKSPENQSSIRILSDVQRRYQQWVSDFDDYKSLSDRYQRYSDLEFMFLNSGVAFLAKELYVSETVTNDEDGYFLKFHAENKQIEKFIYDFVQSVGLTREVLESIAEDIICYGDHILLHIIEPGKGIAGVRPLNVYDLVSRLEFTPAELGQKWYDKMFFTSGTHRNHLISLAQSILDAKSKEDVFNALFDKYLLGFVIGREKNYTVPPWTVTHFRRTASRSEFYPYGRSAFINSLSPFRQLKSAQGLLAMLRAAKIPKEVFKIKGPADGTMSEAEIYRQINRAREQYYNLGIIDNGKEENGVGAAVWTHDALFDYEIISVDTSLDDIADIEMLENDFITSTGIPKEYLLQDKSWGNSGKALLHQSKMFARRIYPNQTALMEGIKNLILLQMEIMGVFDGANTQFEISMPYPIVEEEAEMIDAKKDSLSFAQEVLNSLSAVVGVDVTQFPTPVIKDILSRYSFLSYRDITKWIDAIRAKSRDQSLEVSGRSSELGASADDSFSDLGGGDFSFGSSESLSGGMDFEPENTDEELKGPSADKLSDVIPDMGAAKAAEKLRKRVGTETLKERISRVKNRLNDAIVWRVWTSVQDKYGLYEGVSAGRHWLRSKVNPTHQQVDLSYLKFANLRERLNEVLHD